MSRLLTYDETGQLIQLVRNLLHNPTALVNEPTDRRKLKAIEQKLLQHLNIEALPVPTNTELREAIVTVCAAAEARSSNWRDAAEDWQLDASDPAIIESDGEERTRMADLIAASVSLVTQELLK